VASSGVLRTGGRRDWTRWATRKTARDASGLLVFRNPIYARLFDLQWVRNTRPKQEVRR